MDDKQRLRELLRKRDIYTREHALEYYDPYPYQVEFHNDDARFRVIMAANRLGKSFLGGAEMAYHLTGLYPEWWQGRRFDKAINAVAAGKNNEKTRDLVQAALFGDPSNEEEWGTGFIPKNLIGKVIRKPGVPDAKYHVYVKHTSGMYSKITFLVYDMGKETWMGHKSDAVWLDEEPPEDIMSQANRSVVDTGGIIYMTFTPEQGTTGVVKTVLDQWSVHKAGWKDVSGNDFVIDLGGELVVFKTVYTMKGNPGHLNEEKVRGALIGMMPHEVRMRTMGEPILGSGLVFPYSEGQVSIEPIDIPSHWRRIAAIDFGFTHPTAVVWMAWDEQTDIVYIYDCIRVYQKEIPEVAARIVAKPNQWIPVIWPHDGNKHTGQGGTTKEQYARHGVNMFHTHFTNPPEDGKDKGSINIIDGITEMSARISDGRLKVFNTLPEWFQEYRQYHIDKGKIVDEDDDLMAATRYAIMSLRFAMLEKESDWWDEPYEFERHADSITGY